MECHFVVLTSTFYIGLTVTENWHKMQTVYLGSNKAKRAISKTGYGYNIQKSKEYVHLWNNEVLVPADSW